MSLSFSAGDSADIVVADVPAAAALRYVLRREGDLVTAPIIDYRAPANDSSDEILRDGTTVTVHLEPAATRGLRGLYRQELKAKTDDHDVWLVTDGEVIVEPSLITDDV